VESCTALVEGFDGRFQIVRWTEVRTAAPELVPAESEAIASRHAPSFHRRDLAAFRKPGDGVTGQAVRPA